MLYTITTTNFRGYKSTYTECEIVREDADFIVVKVFTDTKSISKHRIFRKEFVEICPDIGISVGEYVHIILNNDNNYNDEIFSISEITNTDVILDRYGMWKGDKTTVPLSTNIKKVPKELVEAYFSGSI